jgi:beta-phosphoglucomutase-like phosphatase (HAD superfamily)
MPKALSFDLDGTLTGTNALHVATWLEALRPHGVGVDTDLYRTGCPVNRTRRP